MSDGDGTAPRAEISVVIPAHNAERTLHDCIAALRSSGQDIDEIIIADDASQDGAPERSALLDERVRVVRTGEMPVGPAQARNKAVGVARGNIVVLIDADVRVRADTLARLVAPMRVDERVVATFGSYDDDPPASAVASRYANLRHHCVHQMASADATTFWSGLGAVRRDAFLAVGGFDAAFGQPSIEDVELGTRLRARGGRVRLVHEAQATHLKAWTVRGLWKTDVCARAIPWARLSVDRPELRGSLNAGAREKVAALCLAGAAGGGVLSPVLSTWAPWWCIAAAVGSCILMWSVLNRRLLGLLFRRGGARGLFGGALLHAAYYAYAVSVYVIGGAFFKWLATWNRARFATLLWGAGAGAIVCGGAVCLVTGLIETSWLLEHVTALERDPRSARYTVAGLAHVQSKLVVFGTILTAVCGAMVVWSPGWFAREVRGVGGLLRERFGIAGKHRWLIGALVVTYAAVAGMHLNQPIRMDEASSYAMYATTSPFVALLTYETTNNHILNSVLMWCSIQVFGVEAWAVRLPAYLCAIAMPGLLFAAGRRLVSADAGLFAAALGATAGYSIELATNGRGYPIIIACFLALVTVMPDVRQGKPGAALLAIVLGVGGLYAVPVMAFPLAVAYTMGAALVGLDRGLLRQGVRVVYPAILTCIGAALLYLPGWVTRVRRDATDVETFVSPDADVTHAVSLPQVDWETLGFNLNAAAQQMVYPLSGAWGVAMAVVVSVGLVLCVLNSRVARGFAIGVALGVPTVFALTGFQSLPWWTFAWAWPIVLIACGTGMAWVARSICSSMPAGILVVGVVSAVAVGGATWRAGYPRAFPHWVGYRDSPSVADYLVELGLEHDHVVASSAMFRTLNYELNARGVPGRPVVSISELEQLRHDRVVRIVGNVHENRLAAEPFAGDTRAKLHLESSVLVGKSTIETYRVVSGETPLRDEHVQPRARPDS